MDRSECRSTRSTVAIGSHPLHVMLVALSITLLVGVLATALTHRDTGDHFRSPADRALRGVLSGRETPLILAATEPLSAIFRAVNSYPAFEEERISTSPDYLSDHDLANASRAILDRVYVREEAAKALFQTRLVQRRATIDIGEAARAATNGAIERLIVDIDHIVPGTVDETSGRVPCASTVDASSYDVIGEIASRAILTGAKFLGVRRADIPGDAPLAVILRYPV